jgi:DNA processing protein
VNTELLSLMALSRIPGVGNVLIKQLVSYSGSAASVIHASRGQISKIPGIGQINADAILHHRMLMLDEASREIEKVEKSGARLLHYLEPEYPSRLKKIPDAPPVIYLKGSFDFENPRIIAIVGTRQATTYGKEAVDSFLEDLVEYAPVVVSGLAYGIDAQAHKSAIQLGLETWAVLGTAVRQIYPSVHKPLAERILEKGGLLSEVPFDAKPEPTRFPERNRIIAGLSDVVWVVEAKESGGALITARLGIDYFRDVFALAGDYRNESSAGCHALIASGSAGLVYSGKQLAEAAGWEKINTSPKTNQLSQVPGSLPDDPEERVVFEMLKESDAPLDELSWRTGVGVNRMAGILLKLEFSGFVKSLPGKRYSIRR